jgi:hypothetical protein
MAVPESVVVVFAETLSAARTGHAPAFSFQTRKIARFQRFAIGSGV